MERSWERAFDIVAQDEPDLMEAFDFDKIDESANYTFNGLNRLTFPTEDVWRSDAVKWIRRGLGVFDFKLASARTQIPQPSSVVMLEKCANKHTVVMQCVVEEAHLQSRDVVGERSWSEEIKTSTVVGRAVLRLVDFTVT